MKTNYKTIVEAAPALSKLSKLDIKAQEAVKLARLINKIEAELKPFEETRNKLLKKYGEEIENERYKIKDENRSEFEKEFQDLLNSEVEIDAEKFTIKSDVQISAASVIALSDVIEFEE